MRRPLSTRVQTPANCPRRWQATHDIDESVYLDERVIVLSSSPTVVQEDLTIDLPAERDQLNTRALPRFMELRSHVYAKIQRAKLGPVTEQITAQRRAALK